MTDSTPTEPRAAYNPIPAAQVYGYYAYADSGAGCGWTNWILLYTKSIDESVAAADEAKRCGQQVTWSPYRGETTSKVWSETWQSNLALIRPFADAGVLHSIYIADEPYGRWGNYEILASRISDVHAQGWKAFAVEWCSEVSKPHPPIDYFGMDCYQLRGEHNIPEEVESWLVPQVNVYAVQAFGDYEGVYPYEPPQQREQIEMAIRRGLGIAFWKWPSNGRYRGVEDYPEAQRIHRLFGRVVR